MKKFVLAIIIAAGGLTTQVAAAQVGVNVGLRIGPLVINVHKPIAPAVVYDDFYYLPEVDAYYSVPERCYYYMDGGGSWVNAAYLPGRYHDYDWRTARRYEVRAQRPYANHEYYRNKYNGNRGGNWGNDQYAYRRPQGRDDRGSYGRLPSSPYDSNNAGRGGYGRPDYNRGGNWNGQGRGNDRNGSYQPDRNRQDDNRGNWNGQGRGNDRNGAYQPDRNQMPSNGNTNWQPNRGGNNGQNGYGQPSNTNNNQPSNQNGGRDGSSNWQPRRGDNRGNMPDRMHFSRNAMESSRMQVAGN
jgi:hypothetical protein